MSETNSIAAQPRQQYFDVAKGIGILCVIIGHSGFPSADPFIYTFHMPLFFLIAGYFLSLRGTRKQYVKKKAFQLMIPYAFTCFLCCAAAAGKALLAHSGTAQLVADVKLWGFASLYGSGMQYVSPFYIPPIGAIWFLPAMFFAVVIARYFATVRYGFFYVAVIAYVGYTTSSYLWLPMSLQAGMTASLFVLLGYYARQANVPERLGRIEIFLPTLVIWLFCVYTYKMLFMVSNHYENGWMDWVGALCGTAVVIAVSRFLERWLRPVAAVLAFCGRHTLIILCFHLLELNMFPWAPVRAAFTAAGLSDFSNNFCVFLLKLLWAAAWTGIVLCVPFLQRIFSVPPRAKRPRRKPLSTSAKQ